MLHCPTDFSPQDIDALAIALAMTGKFAIAIAFGLIYLYTCELYPTIIRSEQTETKKKHTAPGNTGHLAYIRLFRDLFA